MVSKDFMLFQFSLYTPEMPFVNLCVLEKCYLKENKKPQRHLGTKNFTAEPSAHKGFLYFFLHGQTALRADRVKKSL